VVERQPFPVSQVEFRCRIAFRTGVRCSAAAGTGLDVKLSALMVSLTCSRRRTLDVSSFLTTAGEPATLHNQSATGSRSIAWRSAGSTFVYTSFVS